MKHRRKLVRCSIAALSLVGAAMLALVRPAEAQNDKKAVIEFSSQGMLIVNFTTGDGADFKLAKRAADEVRSRVSRLVNKREVDVIDGGKIHDRVFRADFNAYSTFSPTVVHELNAFFRTDQYLVASIASGANGFTISGEIILTRDIRLRQPIAEVRAQKLDSAAALFAKSIAAAASQIIPQRRCELALHDGNTPRALTAARQGITSYTQSTISRTCLVWTLARTHAPAREVLSAAQEVLAIDPTSFYSLEAAAVALDSLRHTDEAATMYLRLAATDTENIDLALRVAYSLLDGGNSKRAEPFILHMAEAHPDDMRFLRQAWRVTYENKHWSRAVATAETLLVHDSLAKSDSSFFLRLGTAYNAFSNSVHAIETLAHAVSAFPNDIRLYSLYTQYVKAEADAVVPRGLALFPASADLLALNAKELRARGKIAESLDATKRALGLDSTLARARLVVAQLEIELGRPDSALASLRRAVKGGEDSTAVAQFALARGNALYRAANGTKLLDDFALAFRFLSFADTVRSSTHSKFLVGVAALGVAQAALTASSKNADKSEGCRLTKVGQDMLPVARSGLNVGVEPFGDVAKPSLDYLQQLEPFAQNQSKVLCGAAASPPGFH